jgi:hypothetical protein
MNHDDKLKLVQRFLAFYFSPWGAAKGEIWESFSRNRMFSPFQASVICHEILDGKEFDWTGIPELKEGE